MATTMSPRLAGMSMPTCQRLEPEVRGAPKLAELLKVDFGVASWSGHSGRSPPFAMGTESRGAAMIDLLVGSQRHDQREGAALQAERDDFLDPLAAAASGARPRQD